MSVISKFFNKRKPKSLEEKVAELELMSVEQLISIVSSDDDLSLQMEAISRLSFGDDLCNVAFSSSFNSTIQLQAKKRIAQLIDSVDISFQQFVDKTGDVILQLSVLGLCEKTDLVENILNSSDDSQFLYHVAVEGKSAAVRKIAADKIDDVSILKPLLKSSKAKDKAVYKAVRDKLDRIKALEKNKVELEKSIEDLIRQLEIHSKKGYDKLYSAKITQWTNHWQQVVDSATEQQLARAQSLLLLCKSTVERFEQEKKDLQIQANALANNQGVQYQLLIDLEKILISLFDTNVVSVDFRQTIEGKLSEIKNHWEESEKLKLARSADSRKFEILCEAIENQIGVISEENTLLSAIATIRESNSGASDENISDELNTQTEKYYISIERLLKNAKLIGQDRIPQPVIDAKSLIATRLKLRQEKEHEVKTKVRNLSGLVRRTEAAIGRGTSQQAAGMRRSITDKMNKLSSVPDYLVRQIDELDVKLDKLLDWKDYAVEPKKQQLIDQMSALTTSTENPEALAVKIKRLQSQWKELGKGGGERDVLLWDEFYSLAQRAYEPCKLYYEKMALIRKENLEKRLLLVDQLKQFVISQGWDTALQDTANGAIIDENQPERSGLKWKEVEKILTTAINEWHQYSPTDRTATRVLKSDFDLVLGVIRGKLNAEYVKNKQTKQGLIEKAKALLEISDHREATDKVKQLQRVWKNTGNTSHKDDRVLWKEFRENCDAIFEKREEQVSQFKAQLNENKERASTLIGELGSLASLSGQLLLNARVRIEEIKSEFYSIENFPKSSASEIKTSFGKGINLFEDKIAQHHNSAKEQVWGNLLSIADRVRLYQLNILEAEETVANEQPEEMQRAIESTENLPKNGQRCLLNKLESNVSVDEINNYGQALRILCIRAEILSDKTTPDEDSTLRMEYQVDRLKSGFGQKHVDVKAELNSLIFEWVEVGPVATDLYNELLNRFLACR